MVLCVAWYHIKDIYLQYKQQCNERYRLKKRTMQFVTKIKKRCHKD